MQSFMVSLVGLVLSVSVGAEPLLKGRVWLASGPPAAGVQVRLFDLTDLRRSVGTTTDEAGYFALRLAPVGGPALPQDFALGQNYPNPFNPSTIIPYQIPDATHVRLEVFNLLGQRLATLVDGDRPAGAHTAQWDATDATGRAVGAGVFIYRLTGGGHTVSRRMVLLDGQAGIPAGAAGPRQTAAVGVQTAGSVYGLTVAGTGLIAYVDPAFRVGTDPVDLVLEQPGGQARMKVATGGILGDVNNDSQVDEFDVLYVALYSKDSSIALPNHGDISLGDVNGDGTVDLADGLLLALYKVNPSDPTLPPGIGQPVDGSGDDHGDTPSSATALAVGSSRLGQIEIGGDVDYFRVVVSESGDLTVHTTGSLDTKGQLEDSAGGVLARDDDGGDGFNFRLAHAVSAGTYYLKVEGYDATTTGSYTIHASGPSGGGSGPDRNVGEPRMVRMIYFLPNDRPYRQGVVDEMKTMIRQVQTFYAEQMQAHGYGNTTFRFETDAQGEPLVHRVDGQHPERHYDDNSTTGEVLDEIYFGEGPLQFDVLANDYLIVIDNSTGTIDVHGYKAGGVANDYGKRGGITLVPSSLRFSTIAHELGHTFGLEHDFRDDAYIMSYGGNPDRLSACAAEFLSVHPYFNADISLGGEPHLNEGGIFGTAPFGNPSTIEMISSLNYPAGSTSVSVRLEVSDAEGLHQVLLFDQERESDGAAAGLAGLAACRGLDGEKDAVVEFEYDVSIPPFRLDPSDPELHSLYVHVVDADGEVTKSVNLNLVETSSYHIATLDHQNYIRSVSFSPDGTLLATSEELIPTVRLWDAASRQQVATLELEDWSSALSFSPDGTLLAVAVVYDRTRGHISLWDVATRQQVATLELGAWGTTALSFSPDGALLAVAGTGGHISLWDVATRQQVASFQPGDHVYSVSFSPDGTLLATSEVVENNNAASYMVSLWDVASRERVATLQSGGRGGYVSEVSFSPDGTLLATTGDLSQLWDVATRQEITLQPESGGRSLSFSPDGTLLAIGAGGPVRLWNVASRQLVTTFGHPGSVSDMSFSPDHLLATGGSDGTVLLWDVSEWTGGQTVTAVEQAMPIPRRKSPAMAEKAW